MVSSLSGPPRGHPTRTRARAGLSSLPLHVGVLQSLGCTEPLVRGKHQESTEEVQGLWGRVGRQEGVQRVPWPAGTERRPLSRGETLPTATSVAQAAWEGLETPSASPAPAQSSSCSLTPG